MNISYNIKTIFAALAIFAVAALCAAQPSQSAPGGKGKSLKVGVYFNSGSGASASQAYDLAKSALKIYTLEHNYKIDIVKYSSWDDVTADFKANKIDGAYLWPHYVVEILEAGGKVEPLITFSVMNREKMGFCFWQNKNLKMKSPADIVGKKFIFSTPNTYYYIQMKDYLVSNGIDIPLWRVFGSTIGSPTSNSAYMALSMNDADLYWGIDDADAYIKMVSPAAASSLSHQFCSERLYGRANLVLNKKTIPDKDIDEMKAIMSDMIEHYKDYTKKYPDLNGLKQYLKMAKMELKMSPPDAFEYDYKLYMKSKKNGWRDEAEFVYNQFKDAKLGVPITIKPDYNLCKKICAAKKDVTACVYDCMK